MTGFLQLSDASALAYFLTLLLAILAYLLGNKYYKAKQILKDIYKTLKDITESVDDDKITPEEAKKILNDIKALVKEIKGDKNE